MFILLSLAIAVNAMINDNYDRPGDDLAGMPIVLDVCAGESSCADLCKNRGECKSWAFDTCGRQNCWLKDKVPMIQKHDCRVSFPYLVH